ncbi:MAG: PorV/PorQ family protein [Fidelibacterota bacterium]
MKTMFTRGALLLLTLSGLFAQSEAGAIFLLIAPGARAGGMGESQVAIADDAYASYWNPAGLGFLKGTELGLMHVNWLPNLADDLYYDFFTMRHEIPNLGTIGGHLIYLGLGQQIRTDETGQNLGTFTSYMMAFAGSYSALLSRKSSFGLNVKVSYQHLAEQGAGAEKGKGTSTDFGFDIGYLRKDLLGSRLDFGATVTNIGPKVSFIDPAQADPQPTNLTIGMNLKLLKSKYNRLNFSYDIQKILVASYPDMDWDGNGAIGGYDEYGHESTKNADYNKKGQKEIAHTDPIYLAIFTSWVDNWLLGGDIDKSTSSGSNDRIIGGYDWQDNNNNGKIDLDEGEIVKAGADPANGLSYGDEGWGIYNQYGQKEVGSAKDRTIMNEVDQLVHHVGLEYWYSNYFALRMGYLYDKTGKIYNPTFGIGLRFAGYGFDFGYTSGPPGHPLTNTMRFSLGWEF